MTKKGLYANIHAKRKSGRKMKKKGQKGAPTDQDFINAAKTAKKYKHGGKYGPGGMCPRFKHQHD